MEQLEGIVDIGIIGVLLSMSVLACWLFLERLFFYRKVDAKDYPSKDKYELALTRNLTAIATVASNAPYIGLLGTVLAIMLTFVRMSQTSIAAEQIMGALALALKTTAVGLGVAIFAVVFYNILLRKTEALLAEYEA